MLRCLFCPKKFVAFWSRNIVSRENFEILSTKMLLPGFWARHLLQTKFCSKALKFLLAANGQITRKRPFPLKLGVDHMPLCRMGLCAVRRTWFHLLAKRKISPAKSVSSRGKSSSLCNKIFCVLNSALLLWGSIVPGIVHSYWSN